MPDFDNILRRRLQEHVQANAFPALNGNVYGYAEVVSCRMRITEGAVEHTVTLRDGQIIVVSSAVYEEVRSRAIVRGERLLPPIADGSIRSDGSEWQVFRGGRWVRCEPQFNEDPTDFTPDDVSPPSSEAGQVYAAWTQMESRVRRAADARPAGRTRMDGEAFRRYLEQRTFPADSPLTPPVRPLDCHTSVTDTSSARVTGMYRPWVDRYFGVEMEMNEVTTTGVAITAQQLKEAVIRGAVHPVSPRDGWRSTPGSHWDVKTDASCGTQGQGWEIASPKLVLDAAAENAELRAVCREIAALAPRVNRKCGLHITVDVSDLTVQQTRNLIVLWARYEPYVFELCPQTRRANQYCPPIRKARWADQNATAWVQIERTITPPDGSALLRTAGDATPFPRGALNMRNWATQKRIEFRLQAGTVNYEKIRRWTQFLLAFVERVKQGAPFPMIQSGGWSDRGFSTMYVFKMLGLAPSKFCPEVPVESVELMRWAEERRTKFKEDAVATAATAHRSF